MSSWIVRRGLRATELLRIVVLLTALGGATACSDDPSSPRREFGTYTLVRVNDQPLPFSITTASGAMVVQNATIQLSAGIGSPTYAASVNGTDDGVAGVLLVDAGTYTVTGGTLTFASNVVPGLVYPGAWSAGILTVTVPGVAIGASGTISMRFEK